MFGKASIKEKRPWHKFKFNAQIVSGLFRQVSNFSLLKIDLVHKQNVDCVDFFSFWKTKRRLWEPEILQTLSRDQQKEISLTNCFLH